MLLWQLGWKELPKDGPESKTDVFISYKTGVITYSLTPYINLVILKTCDFQFNMAN